MNLRSSSLLRLVILAVIGLAIAYIALLQPLARRVVEEQEPLDKLRQRLAQATLEAGLPRDGSFEALGSRLAALRNASAAFSGVVRASLPRLEHPPEIRARLQEPFQLVEFLNESQRRLEELAAQASARKTSLTPGLPRGFPAYKPELARPELLWVQLATVNRVVLAAIRAGVRDVSEVSVDPLPLAEAADFNLPPSPPPPPSAGPDGNGHWTVLRLHLTTTGTVDALTRLLLALALTPEELAQAGLSAEPGGRPALFLDRLLLRRAQLDAPEQAQLQLVVSTVVANEEP